MLQQAFVPLERWHKLIPTTALLKAVAEGLIPGIPWNLRIQLLGQTNLDIDDSSQDNEAETVLRHVVRSDRMRERLLREAEGMLLTTLLEGTRTLTEWW